MYRLSQLFALAIQLPLLVVLALPAAPDTAPSAAKITNYGLNGSGCPPGTFSAKLTDGDTSISASFSKFSPVVSSGELPRQNCQATVEVDVPAGKQFTLKGVSYDGYVQVSSDVRVTHTGLYYFQGDLNQQSKSATINGPMAGHKDFSTSFSGTPIYSACGPTKAIINVAVYMFLETDKGSGFTNVDSAKIGPFELRDC